MILGLSILFPVEEKDAERNRFLSLSMGRGLNIGVLLCERYSPIFGRCRFLGGGGMFFRVPVSCARV